MDSGVSCSRVSRRVAVTTISSTVWVSARALSCASASPAGEGADWARAGESGALQASS